MTEKRFTITICDNYKSILKDRDSTLSIMLGVMRSKEEVELCEILNSLHEENEELRQQNKKILDTINNKIIEKGMDWYKAEDNSKEEKKANLQLNVLEEVRDEIKGEWRKCGNINHF